MVQVRKKAMLYIEPYTGPTPIVQLISSARRVGRNRKAAGAA
jgi:hypothetical protein